MKIIALDTAGKNCSVAIVEDENILAETVCSDGRTHSVNLMGIIEQLFSQSKFDFEDLDCFAVSVGPGTFTGLRIGISTIKGMCYGSGKPLIGINSLDALAFFPLKLNKLALPVVSMIDARRGEIYYACYNHIELVNNKISSSNVSYKVATPENAISDIYSGSTLVGSGAIAYSDFFQKNLEHIRIEKEYSTIKASSVAFLAAQTFANGNNDQVNTLIPYYIRKADAQIYFNK